MRELVLTAALIASTPFGLPAFADSGLLNTHCGTCHTGGDAEGTFELSMLGQRPSSDNIDLWALALDYVAAGEMPPALESELSEQDRRRMVAEFRENIRRYEQSVGRSAKTKARRLNNRELANSVSDVLGIEDVGTHQPTANLVGDSLHQGFDTNGDALGMNVFQLEQYIKAFRKIVDATILTGERPETRRYEIASDDMELFSVKQGRQTRQEESTRTPTSLDIPDPDSHLRFSNFESFPATGTYRITIRATGIDRGIYDASRTGVYPADPIKLSVHLGDRVRTFDLLDDKIQEIQLEQWVAEDTKLNLAYPTDGLDLEGNGNFKFQYRIASDHLKKNKPELYARVVNEEVPKARRRSDAPDHWVHWVDYWQGPRPRLFTAEIEGPIYETWPPKRQVALLGESPRADNAFQILLPIAERAWRREVRREELAPITHMVRSQAKRLGDIEAFKEGLVAILASPSFLLIHQEGGNRADRFATKLSYFLQSTAPDRRLREAAFDGELDTYQQVRSEIQHRFDRSQADAFLKEFPQAWLELDRIHFMGPDPEQYRFYDRKQLSEDMVAEVLRFFRHAIESNIPVPELVSADYSFLNADLAKVYGVDGVPQDSKLRKYTFTGGRRGGLLGMGAFLTLTADVRSTSPIHRGVYVMEKFMGIHPDPPPADVKITEPDVRQAKTIKEILAAHMSDANCASCHKTIDPYGYAFENFDPTGAWRDKYVMEKTSIAVDASSAFRSGVEYQDIREYRQHLTSDANRNRFVRCFIKKLLTYANGTAPESHSEVEKILATSAEHDYRIVDTIAAVVVSPLFREP